MERVVTISRKAMQIPIIAFLIFAGFSQGQTVLAGEKSSPTLSRYAVLQNAQIARAQQLGQMQQEFLDAVQAKLASAKHDAVFRTKIAELPAGEKMAVFMRAVRVAKKRGLQPLAMLKDLKAQRSPQLQSVANVSISGTVTVEGAPTFDSIDVVAFDSFGFFAASATVDGTTGAYSINDLSPGSYFVVTESGFVDEFYDNIPVDSYTNWRAATPVVVTETGPVTSIDFDLQRGATISGTVTDDMTDLPMEFEFVDFTVISTTDPDVQFNASALTNANGEYEIIVPATGTFKILAEIFGFEPEYWDNKRDFASADPIVINSVDDVITGIDFSLSEETTAEGGRIMGNVTAPEMQPVPFAFVFAFDVSDTSIASLTLAGFAGEYELSGLSAGNYVVYADQLLDILFPPALEGEYYDNAKTSDQATVLTVGETDTLTGIDFSLEPGGAIAGNISADTGTALDSVLVVAVKLDISNVGKFFTDDIDFGVAFSGPEGDYVVSGLSSGDYKLRTVSLLGKHAGIYLDEYYEDVQNLFDPGQAMPVTVTSPDTAKNIDFVLTTGGRISGHFYDIGTTTPVLGNGTVVAFNDATGYPELAFTEYDSLSGEYSIGPLPTGNFKLFGFVSDVDLNLDLGLFSTQKQSRNHLSSEDVVYLPQFYDGKSSLDDADLVSVTTPTVTSGIDFSMVRAGSVQGHVNVAAGVSAGADSLVNTVVVAFDSNTGEMLGGTTLTFAGGYKIAGLPPVDVKVAALPLSDGFSATYFGGGTRFDDANATAVTVTPDNTSFAEIDLASANGKISGTVYGDDGSTPLSGVIVIAYDETGHAVSAGISGFQIDFFTPTNPGAYTIEGLPAGTYFLRTVALFQLVRNLDTFDLGTLSGDLLGMLFGGLGDASSLDLLDIQLYNDSWYDGESIALDLGNVDIFSLLFQLLVSSDPQFILPFFETIPAGATPVVVPAGGATGGIDFILGRFENPLTSVNDERGSGFVPTEFVLSQNYPNPFNPSTVIQYSLPVQSRVSLAVYNLLGQHIRTLVDGVKEAGAHSVQWDGVDDRGVQVAGGIYFIRLKSDNVSLTRKAVFMK